MGASTATSGMDHGAWSVLARPLRQIRDGLHRDLNAGARALAEYFLLWDAVARGSTRYRLATRNLSAPNRLMQRAPSRREGYPMAKYKVGYLVGSLATASINRKLALALCRLAPPELELAEISFRELPLYSYDYDADYPAARAGLQGGDHGVGRHALCQSGVQPVHPGRAEERHRLGQPALWEQRLHPQAVGGDRRPRLGRSGLRWHSNSLSGVLAFCNSPLMNSPEAYIQFTPGMITDDGTVTVASTEEFLRNYMAEFADFIGRVYTALPRGPKADTAGKT